MARESWRQGPIDIGGGGGGRSWPPNMPRFPAAALKAAADGT